MVISNISFVLCIILIATDFILGRNNLAVKGASGKIYRMYNVYLFIMALMLILFAGLRGNFTIDYNNYDWLFTRGFSRESFLELLTEKDFGFAILNKIIYQISDQTVILMLVLATVTITCYYQVIKRESVDYFLSLLIFVVLDNYIISFNLTRNIMACALFFLSSDLIVKKKLPQYIVAILLISLLHRSALLMMPMYWILRFDFKSRKNQAITFFGLAIFMILIIKINSIALTVSKMIGYNWNSDGFGVGQGSLGSLLKTLLLLMVVLLLYRQLEYTDIKERIWFNGCIFNVIFQLCSYRFFMMQRVGFYFSGFFFLLIPLLISRKKPKIGKQYKVSIIAIVVIYALLFRGGSEYYLFTSNT